MGSIRVSGKLAVAAVVAGLIVGPASANATTLSPSTIATTNSNGVVTDTTAVYQIPFSVETGRKVH